MSTAPRTIVNLPKSHRVVNRFKDKFPNATYYGATSLGSGRASYLIPTEEANRRKDELKELKISIPKHQPFNK